MFEHDSRQLNKKGKVGAIFGVHQHTSLGWVPPRVKVNFTRYNLVPIMSAGHERGLEVGKVWFADVVVSHTCATGLCNECGCNQLREICDIVANILRYRMIIQFQELISRGCRRPCLLLEINSNGFLL